MNRSDITIKVRKPTTVCDLHKINTYQYTEEQRAVFEIQRQIRKWLEVTYGDQTILDNSKYNSIIINKITYFSARAIQKTNPNLVISGGWYIYGPCYELGRHSEESISLMVFDTLNTSETVIQEINDACSEQVAKFIDSADKEGFPYQYLQHIYANKSEYKELKDFYLSKHELTKKLFNFKKTKKEGTAIDYEEISHAITEFETAISSEKYYKKINLPEDDVYTVLEFTGLMQHLLEKKYYGNENLRWELLKSFQELIVLGFACKNYNHTFESKNQTWERKIKENMQKKYTSAIGAIKNKLPAYYTQVS